MRVCGSAGNNTRSTDKPLGVAGASLMLPVSRHQVLPHGVVMLMSSAYVPVNMLLENEIFRVPQSYFPPRKITLRYAA